MAAKSMRHDRGSVPLGMVGQRRRFLRGDAAGTRRQPGNRFAPAGGPRRERIGFKTLNTDRTTNSLGAVHWQLLKGVSRC